LIGKRILFRNHDTVPYLGKIGRLGLLVSSLAFVTGCANNIRITQNTDNLPIDAPEVILEAPLVEPSPVPFAAQTANLPLNLEQAVEIAVADNPSLAMIQARARALGSVPTQVGTLPDPMLSVNALNLPTDTFEFNQEPMTQVPQISLTQDLPFPGTLGLRREVAEYEALAAVDAVAERRLTLIQDVKLVWWNLMYLDQALEIVAENQELLRELVKITQTKYAVGDGLPQDVLLAEVELSKLLDEEIRLKGLREVEEARLNALLDRPLDAPISLPSVVTKLDLPELKLEAALLALARDNQPLLMAQQKEIEAARARLELAKKDYYPDFKVGAAYGVRHGNDASGDDRPDFASVLFSMSLPLYIDKLDSAVAQRRSELLKQRYALQDAGLEVQKKVSTTFADYQRARRQIELFEKGIIPQARQTVASMVAGYQVGQVDFLSLVNAELILFNYEIQLWKMISMAHQSLAQLIAATAQKSVTDITKPAQEKAHE
jgi:outer membrane protein TolC